MDVCNKPPEETAFRNRKRYPLIGAPGTVAARNPESLRSESAARPAGVPGRGVSEGSSDPSLRTRRGDAAEGRVRLAIEHRCPVHAGLIAGPPYATELPEDFCDLLLDLADAGAEFVLVGGYAVAFHGHPRATKDMDVLIRADVSNPRA